MAILQTTGNYLANLLISISAARVGSHKILFVYYISLEKVGMKKTWLFSIAVAAISFCQTSCEKSPQVFSVNNFSLIQDTGRARIGVEALAVPTITGRWRGLEHEIIIVPTNEVNGLALYSVGLIDTVGSIESSTTWLDIDFMSVYGRPFVEVIDWANKSGHNFNLVLSTYIRINKLTNDTIIVQMQNSSFTQGWLRTKGYRYFETAEEKNNEDHAVYLTEDLPRLAALLKELYQLPQAFQVPDTIVRKP